jgi:hypothetical protein
VGGNLFHYSYISHHIEQNSVQYFTVHRANRIQTDFFGHPQAREARLVFQCANSPGLRMNDISIGKLKE